MPTLKIPKTRIQQHHEINMSEQTNLPDTEYSARELFGIDS